MLAHDAPVDPPLLTLDAALSRLLGAARVLADTEIIPTLHANGRVLAQAVRSGLNVPSADTARMDGYAVRTADLRVAGARLRVTQRIPAGRIGQPLGAGEAARIFTGAPIPPGADAVVMQEQCQADPASGVVIIGGAPRPGEWIRRAGEDIAALAEILPRGTRLGPPQLGLAAAVGCASVPVTRRPRVAMFCTGDELVMPGEPLKPGALYNSNRFTLRALLENLGCDLTDLGIVPDTLPATRDALREAARRHDLILTSGGVSVGEEDHIKPAVIAEGRLDLWRIALKPGKPLAFGEIRRPEGQANRPPAFFLGLPGNPVSSFVTFVLAVRPFILRLQGAADVSPKHIPLRADFAWPGDARRREFLRARINAQGGLDRFPDQSSGALTSTVWGDGLIDNPPGQPIAPGDVVQFIPFAELT